MIFREKLGKKQRNKIEASTTLIYLRTAVSANQMPKTDYRWADLQAIDRKKRTERRKQEINQADQRTIETGKQKNCTQIEEDCKMRKPYFIHGQEEGYGWDKLISWRSTEENETRGDDSTKAVVRNRRFLLFLMQFYYGRHCVVLTHPRTGPYLSSRQLDLFLFFISNSCTAWLAAYQKDGSGPARPGPNFEWTYP